MPVAVCGQSRDLKNSTGITFVYTPPYLRNKGYASSCVAGVGQKMLDKGFKYCYLFADAANPISNNVYTQIGYEMVGSTENIDFK